MPILIDGYNLLHASGVFPPDHLAGTLHAARTALLEALVRLLEPRELLQTTIVFDAAEAPPGLPRQTWFQGLNVQFAASHEDADALIERLIEDSPAPKELLVVSSDHRLHRAARRRKAGVSDSGPWFATLLARASVSEQALSAKPMHRPSESEVSFWLQEFSSQQGSGEIASEGAGRHGDKSPASQSERDPVPQGERKQSEGSSNSKSKSKAQESEEIEKEDNPYYPFPPNFADGLFDEEE